MKEYSVELSKGNSRDFACSSHIFAIKKEKGRKKHKRPISEFQTTGRWTNEEHIKFIEGNSQLTYLIINRIAKIRQTMDADAEGYTE